MCIVSSCIIPDISAANGSINETANGQVRQPENRAIHPYRTQSRPDVLSRMRNTIISGLEEIFYK